MMIQEGIFLPKLLIRQFCYIHASEIQTAEIQVFNTDLLSPRLWMWVSRCILNVYRFLKDLPHCKDRKGSSTRGLQYIEKSIKLCVHSLLHLYWAGKSSIQLKEGR